VRNVLILATNVYADDRDIVKVIELAARVTLRGTLSGHRHIKRMTTLTEGLPSCLRISASGNPTAQAIGHTVKAESCAANVLCTSLSTSIQRDVTATMAHQNVVGRTSNVVIDFAVAGFFLSVDHKG